MQMDIAARFRTFADSFGPIDLVDPVSGLIGADLHDIAANMEDTTVGDLVILPELDLSGGANGLRTLGQ